MPRITFDYQESDYVTFPTDRDLLRYLGDILDDTAEEVRNEYNKIVSGFNSARSKRVRFVVAGAKLGRLRAHNYTGRAIYAAAGTNFTRTPIVWLDEGTSWRARGMSPNWQSKTRPGSLSVGPGRGFAANKWGVFPGIEARHFRISIIEKLQSIFERKVARRMQPMLRAMGW